MKWEELFYLPTPWNISGRKRMCAHRWGGALMYIRKLTIQITKETVSMCRKNDPCRLNLDTRFSWDTQRMSTRRNDSTEWPWTHLLGQSTYHKSRAQEGSDGVLHVLVGFVQRVTSSYIMLVCWRVCLYVLIHSRCIHVSQCKSILQLNPLSSVTQLSYLLFHFTSMT